MEAAPRIELLGAVFQVAGDTGGDGRDSALHDWRVASSTAREAYGNWRRMRDAASYAAYRAAADQADAAQDALTAA